MGINADHFRLYVVREPLQACGLWSETIEELMMGTAAHESMLGSFLHQINGPALGVYQIEPVTAYDLMERYLLRKRRDLSIRIARGLGRHVPLQRSEMIQAMKTDLSMQTIVARVRYITRPEPLPPMSLQKHAEYWGRHYQTESNPQKISQYVFRYKELVGGPLVST